MHITSATQNTAKYLFKTMMFLQKTIS